MATRQDTRTEARERPSDIIAQLHAAGVDHDLTMRTFDCIETERAEAIAKAARLFYCPADEQGPMTLGEFSDQFNNMSRRLWGISAAVDDVLGERDDSVGSGVMQLVQDAAREMERLAEAFDAERWLERKREKRS